MSHSQSYVSNGPACVCAPWARRGQGQFTPGTDVVKRNGFGKWEIWSLNCSARVKGGGARQSAGCEQGIWFGSQPTGHVLHVFGTENVPLALAPVHMGQKVWVSKERVFLRGHPQQLPTKRKFTQELFDPDLVYKLLHTRLQAPDFKLDCDKFVGAHDGVLVVDPSFLQDASVSLLWLKIPQVLQGHETPKSEKKNPMSLFLHEHDKTRP